MRQLTILRLFPYISSNRRSSLISNTSRRLPVKSLARWDGDAIHQCYTIEPLRQLVPLFDNRLLKFEQLQPKLIVCLLCMYDVIMTS